MVFYPFPVPTPLEGSLSLFILPGWNLPGNKEDYVFYQEKDGILKKLHPSESPLTLSLSPDLGGEGGVRGWTVFP